MRYLVVLTMMAVAGCSTKPVNEPSLAPRPAESIDPRLPVRGTPQSGSVNPELARTLDMLVGRVRAAAPQFEAMEATASRLAAAAGPMASESWIAAEQALSRLVELHGMTTQAAADIDELAADRLEGQRWIRPADQQAIAAAAAEVGSINGAQTAAIDRLKNQLAR